MHCRVGAYTSMKFPLAKKNKQISLNSISPGPVAARVPSCWSTRKKFRKLEETLIVSLWAQGRKAEGKQKKAAGKQKECYWKATASHRKWPHHRTQGSVNTCEWKAGWNVFASPHWRPAVNHITLNSSIHFSFQILKSLPQMCVVATYFYLPQAHDF